jgi:hypothetical protein
MKQLKRMECIDESHEELHLFMLVFCLIFPFYAYLEIELSTELQENTA